MLLVMVPAKKPQKTTPDEPESGGLGSVDEFVEAEDGVEDQGADQGHEERPGDAQKRLLVADANVSPCEHSEQAAIAQNFRELFAQHWLSIKQTKCR